MTWEKKIGTDGLPVWSGQDSLVNTLAPVESSMRLVWAGGWVLVVMGALFAVASIFLLIDTPPHQRTVMTILSAFLVLTMLGFGVFSLRLGREYQTVGKTSLLGAFASYKVGVSIEKPSQPFFRANWKFTATFDRLTYRGAESWAVDLSDVARIETSKTREWELTRNLAPYVPEFKRPSALAQVKVPEHEYQTFLVLRDTSRRVILTANADREGCSTLAGSIREYLETVRGAATPASSDSVVAAAPAGFDL